MPGMLTFSVVAGGDDEEETPHLPPRRETLGTGLTPTPSSHRTELTTGSHPATR